MKWNACEFIKFEACEGSTGTTGTNGTSGSTISEVNDDEESSLELKPVDTKIIYIWLRCGLVNAINDY